MTNLFIVIAAMIIVESGGNTRAIGDGGRARGCLQIHEIVIKDVSRITKSKYTWNDAWNEEKSIEICTKYLSYYCTEKRLGHIPTYEDYARVWNGGPDGFKKDSTKKYWAKVKKQISLTILN